MFYKIPDFLRYLVYSGILLLAAMQFIEKGYSQAAGLFEDRPVSYKISTSLYGSRSGTPYWHYANTSGRIRSGSTVNSLSSAALSMPFRENDNSFDFSAGAELVSRFSDNGETVHFQQLYGSFELGAVRLSIGRFYQTLGMNMAGLSSGSMIQSQNATPVPKISLEMTRFVNLPLTNGIVQFRGHYSDGKLESNRFVESPFLHQKSFYLKFNISKAEIITGALHNVTWGGTDPERGRLSKGFGDYLRVVFLQSADPGSEAPLSEQLNKLGNVVAAFDFAFRYNFERFQLTGYRLIYLEDDESLQAKNFLDGVFGLGLRRKDGRGIINGFLYEHINTI
ncbi:MAG: capsule assembly Wzi family protein, partial [Balneolaceae bacterium]